MDDRGALKAEMTGGLGWKVRLTLAGMVAESIVWMAPLIVISHLTGKLLVQAAADHQEACVGAVRLDPGGHPQEVGVPLHGVPPGDDADHRGVGGEQQDVVDQGVEGAIRCQGRFRRFPGYDEPEQLQLEVIVRHDAVEVGDRKRGLLK